KPVGTERVNADGYVDIKIQDGKAQKNWRGKHLLTWEEHHGRPVPPGHAVIFGDRNRRNFNPDNLILVSRKQLAIMNKNNLIQGNAELTRTGIIIADVLKKIGDRKGKRRKATGCSKRGGA
ncbi:MAG: HNH endonuclease signature motif containing protein, partial [Candidatus Desulforudaceae bacterium]